MAVYQWRALCVRVFLEEALGACGGCSRREWVRVRVELGMVHAWFCGSRVLVRGFRVKSGRTRFLEVARAMF